MNRDTDRLGDAPFDILIVGGGIIGAGVARDAAMRGLRVALIDQGDFGSGTSSRSSKLVHGGLRYLERAEFRLVHEACRERRILLRIAPHLVKPQPILFPCYHGTGRPLWKIRCGLALYDFLAGDRAIGTHRMVSPEEIHRLEPAMDPRRLDGGGIYYDCRMNDSRLCLENVISADRNGAAVANYVRLAGFSKSSGAISGAAVEDLETGKEIHIRAGIIVNATGPWADQLRIMDDPAAHSVVRKTKGIHLLTRRLLQSTGAAWTARSDGRMLFLMPFDDAHSLIGTTDTDSREDPSDPGIDPGDIEYLLAEVNAVLAGSPLSRRDVRGVFAGLRTLISHPGNPSDLSREYKIEESRSGLISVIGGKFTTYRAMAERVVDRVMRRLRRPRIPCRTDRVALAEGQAGDGIDAGQIAEEEIFPNCGVAWEDAVYAIRFEMARRPIDFLRRRTTLALIHPPSADVLMTLSKIFQKHLGWDSEKTERESASAQHEWARHHIPKE